MLLVLGDSDATMNLWYANYNTNIKGINNGILSASFEFNQIINKPP